MRVRNWAIGAFVVLACVVVWLGVGGKAKEKEREVAKVEQDLATALARAESLGVPVYAEHLRQDPIPDEDNAWIEIQAVHKWREDNNENLPELGSLLSETDDALFLSLAPDVLAHYAEAFPLAERAAEKNRYSPLREWERSNAMLMSDLATMKSLLMLFAVRSRYELLSGKPEQAIESLKTASNLIGYYVKETTLLGQLVWISGSHIVAKETVRQAMRTDSENYLQQLREVLGSLFPPIDYTKALFQEQVLFIGWVKMASIESDLGNEFRQEFEDMGNLSVLGGIEGTSLSPLETKKFEVLAIEAVCDYSESLKSDAKEFAENDRLYEVLDSKILEWCIDGYSVGFVEMALIFDSGFDKPYTGLVRRELAKESFRIALEIAARKQPLQDGLTWKADVLPGASFEVYETDTGWSIASNADDVDEITLNFDWPS